jgi:hypothetical protein
MTDKELVKRLRDAAFLAFDDGTNDYGTPVEAADRIDELEVSLQAVLNREAATTARYDAKTDELEAKLATCEKYRDAYAECDSIGTQAVRDLEAKLAECEARLGKVVEGLLLARVHVANNEQGWSVGRASARSDLKIINALLAEIEGEKG